MKVILLLSTFIIIALGNVNGQLMDWWQTASFYQIYPRSFRDSDGDGIGDLNGISEKLQYLKDIGITCAWLSPIFKSPMADFGYDISDFYSIQPEYGTMDDFDRLIKHAKQIGMKILLDFVPNHSSDENEWFQKSVNRVAGYEDFYVWSDGIVDPNNATNRLPPSNWISLFRKSAWQWNDIRKQFYLHQFLVKQPDLNYRNPIVVEEMKSVLRFWLDRGIDGFRIDAVFTLFETKSFPNGTYRDEPKSGFTDDPDNSNYLNHIYTQDQPETADMIFQWRALLDTYKKDHGGDTKVIMVESYSDVSVLMSYYGNETTDGAHIPFNFRFILQINNGSKAQDYVNTINSWMSQLPAGRTANWVMGNHDQNRVGSRLGADRIDSMNMILMTLPGVSVSYNGEEIGMVDQWLSWEDTVDPAACNSNPDIYTQFSRDPARTPFQWDSTMNAGFSSAAKTWLPVASNYKTINVQSEMASAKSHLKIYISAIQLRKKSTIRYGSVKSMALNNNNVLAILRYRNLDYSYITLVNVGDNLEQVNLNQLVALPNELVYVIVSVSSTHQIGSTISSSSVVLQPKESFILKTLTYQYST